MLLSKLGRSKVNWQKKHELKINSIVFQDSIFSKGIINDKEFKFLNLKHKFKYKIDWNFNHYGKLWTYNLNYFDWLQQEDIEVNFGLETVNNYIESLQELKDGLEPFPISLRIINWVKFVVNHNINDSRINDAIINQANQLENKLEYHLLGNHLLENFFALVCFSVFINDKTKFEKYSTLLRKQLNEQVLDDGGHFELSPMYHQIMLFRLLDTINFINGSGFSKDEILNELQSKATKMLAWLNKMTFASGNIPLFNDSAFGIAPTTEQLNNYAERLKIKEAKNIPLSDSGYRKFQLDNIEMIMDVGSIGADYIPGHAHSDMLSFEMQYNKKPFIVDTGLSTYEIGEDRDRERSTDSHNTVVVNNQNQSQVWGGFRVAKRADILVESESVNEIVGSHNGYECFDTKTKRIFKKLKDGFEIEDILIRNKPNDARAFLHFHPNVKIELNNTICNTNLGTVEFINATKIEMQDYLYAPGFNKRMKGTKLIVSFEEKLITKIY